MQAAHRLFQVDAMLILESQHSSEQTVPDTPQRRQLLVYKTVGMIA